MMPKTMNDGLLVGNIIGFRFSPNMFPKLLWLPYQSIVAMNSWMMLIGTTMAMNKPKFIVINGAALCSTRT